MLKEVILVPKDKCPLDVLAEMGSQTANAWIFLHKNAVEKLRSTADQVNEFPSMIEFQSEFKWNATPEYPATLLQITHLPKIVNSREEWIKVYRIKASDIAFEYSASDPEYLFFLKMEE